jgi:hypothetical protein
MARTIKEIQDEIIAVKNSNANLVNLTSPSQTAMWLAWTYVVAVAFWTLEKLFDAHVALVREILATDKSHTLRWYQNKALLFQYGSALPDGKDVYDNTLLTEAQIVAQKIIKQAAAVEDNGIVTVKAAKEAAGELVPLGVAEYNAWFSYMQELKDAGVNLQAISFAGDKLKLTLDIEYDPQVLNAAGARVDGADATPVKNAINTYLRNLPFNGIFRIDKLVDALQAVEGVVIPTVLQAQAAKNDVLFFINVNIKYQPYSGYLRLWNDLDLVINYRPTA